MPWSLQWLPLCCQETEKSDATGEKSDATGDQSDSKDEKSDSKDEKSDATNETEAHTEDKADKGAPEEAQSDQTPPEGQQVIFPFSLWPEGFTCAKHMKHKPTGPPSVPLWLIAEWSCLSFGCIFFDIRMIWNLDKTPGNFALDLE